MNETVVMRNIKLVAESLAVTFSATLHQFPASIISGWLQDVSATDSLHFQAAFS